MLSGHVDAMWITGMHILSPEKLKILAESGDLIFSKDLP